MSSEADSLLLLLLFYCTRTLLIVPLCVNNIDVTVILVFIESFVEIGWDAHVVVVYFADAFAEHWVGWEHVVEDLVIG